MIGRKRISRRHLISILVSAICWSVLPSTALAKGEVEAQPLASVKSSQAAAFPNWVERLAENGCSFKHYELPW